MNNPNDVYSQIRQYLLDELREDLCGPSAPTEELTDRPTIHYLTGILYPENNEIDPTEDDDAGEASDSDDEVDTGTLMASATNPTSIGITFRARKGAKLSIFFNTAVYQPEERAKMAAREVMSTQDAMEPEILPDVPLTDGPQDSESKVEKKKTIWQRKPIHEGPFSLIAEGSGIDSYPQIPPPIQAGLQLLIRKRDRGDHEVITVSLVNRNQVEESHSEVDELCFFQPEIIVETTEPPVEGTFISGHKMGARLEGDRRNIDMLYRNVPEYAVGHGCAVTWETDDGRVRRLRTQIIPSYELNQVTPELREKFKALGMQYLAEAPEDQLVQSLSEFLTGYTRWIKDRTVESGSLPAQYKDCANENLQFCETAAERISAAIDLIKKDQDVRLAFQLANQAMLVQRARITWMRLPADQRPETPVLSTDHRWRAFQLAFILLSIPSISDPKDDFRSAVDLLWFPTGGGKTEAYLGLVAFTIFLRRLRGKGNPKSAGVTALMRYTLRLLTIQQFQRASTLILACDRIRANRKGLGDQEISIGLWVGGGATPNHLREARTALQKLRNGEDVFEGNPYQIRACPWCGTELAPEDYFVDSAMTIRCPNERCEYSGGLPLYIVDDDVYSQKPSLLIGTVDKFARMPWIEEPSRLFGLDVAHQAPPELIIQDELHLISGPLGSLVGLYETAVDALCSQAGSPPKIIASTATIRRAGDQVKALFNRDLFQFPPSGLMADDSYFAQRVAPEEVPGRMYVGVYAPGKSMKTAVLRVYANLLEKIHEHESPESFKDPYWTLVGYFNSLRELGGAIRLVNDDVPDRIKVLARRHPGQRGRRFIERYTELDSNVSSLELPAILRDMELTMDNYPLDVLLATNMISVGVDVDRLGLMVVTGQPKNTAEYIQATSRIGRKYPGLVVTVYSWSRPRDRSHYERFTGYHSSIYSQVEASSATPFSRRARDRGLHGVFVTLMRYLGENMLHDASAQNFRRDHPAVRMVRELILERIRMVDRDEAQEAAEQIDQILERWQLLVQRGKLHYTLPFFRRENDEGNTYLMVPAETPELADDPESFPTLNSLREVEGEAGLSFRLTETH